GSHRARQDPRGRRRAARRVVSLTPFALVALVLAALVGVVAQWSGSLLAELWWRAVVALGAVGAAHELYVTRRLAVGASWAQRAALYLGRTATLDLKVANHSRRSLEVELAPAWPDGLAGESSTRRLRVAPLAAETAALDARAIALGVHAWPRLPTRVRGPL